METVAPFCAWRYAPSAGELAQLVAPPYDIIGPELQSRLYARSMHNVVRVDLGMTTPSDNECDNQYTRAASQLLKWKRSGVLVRDAQPSITFVEETFVGPDGRNRTRHGFLALMRLHGFDEGVVFPHERTFSGPKEDRYRLMTATTMSLSPVFLLYDLPGDEITTAWKTGPGAQAPKAAMVDEMGTVTSLWPTSDRSLLESVRQSLGTARFIIADGHHRYETALRYKKNRSLEVEAEIDTRASTTGTGRSAEPPAWEYALAYFSNMADPGLAVYGTHRLVFGFDPKMVAALPQSLTDTFAVEHLGGGYTAAAAQTAIAAFLANHPRGAFGLWSPALGGAYGLRLTDPGAARAAAPGHSAAYQLLDVTVLQTLILEKVLGITADGTTLENHLAFFKDPDDAFARLEAGDFQAGFFMNPTGLDQVREMAFAGERMPQKATFFYPKLPTGLVFYDLSA